MIKYHVKKGIESYGYPIGILLIDCSTPFIPGDVGNASTYTFPVLYKTVPDLTLQKLIEEEDLNLTNAVIRAAKELENAGVHAISSDCGYMIHFQRQVASEVNVPVIMSSLIQLPMLERTIGPLKKIGVICANRKKLSPNILDIAGVKDKSSIIIRGMEEMPYFRAPILDEKPELVYEEIEKEIVSVAEEMVTTHPEIGPILLECSNMPPYAHAVQKATGRIVFDFTTLINHFFNASFRKPFKGFF